MIQRLLIAATLTLAPVVAAADLVVLQYHHISDQTPASTSTTTELFATHLERIHQLELEVVPLEAGTRAALAGELNDRQQLAITFDDAYTSVWTTAAPMLEDAGYPYTIFVDTASVGQPGYMTWDQLKQASQRQGVTIANHSHGHGHLAKRPDESASAWRERASNSLDQAQALLENNLGEAPPLFAYPYGEYDQALEQLVDARDWLAYGQQSGAIGKTSDAGRLPRFPMATAYGQPESLNDKLRSRSLPVSASDLPDGILDDNPPELTLTLPAGLRPDALTCFGSGQGRLPVTIDGQRVTVRAPEAFNSRRFRYNCTYPAGNGQFYWLSQQWLDLTRPED